MIEFADHHRKGIAFTGVDESPAVMVGTTRGDQCSGPANWAQKIEASAAAACTRSPGPVGVQDPKNPDTVLYRSCALRPAAPPRGHGAQEGRRQVRFRGSARAAALRDRHGVGGPLAKFGA